MNSKEKEYFRSCDMNENLREAKTSDLDSHRNFNWDPAPDTILSTETQTYAGQKP